jgi:hypothetical protein
MALFKVPSTALCSNFSPLHDTVTYVLEITAKNVGHPCQINMQVTKIPLHDTVTSVLEITAKNVDHPCQINLQVTKIPLSLKQGCGRTLAGWAASSRARGRLQGLRTHGCRWRILLVL